MPTAYDHFIEGDCGIDAAEEAREEAREEYIEDNAQDIARRIMSDAEFAADVCIDQHWNDEVTHEILKAVGYFWTAYRAATTADGEAAAGFALYRMLKPTIEAAALEQAKQEAGDAFDKQEAAMPRTQAEYRAEVAL